MRVIDARSGRELKVGETVEYGNGETMRLVDVEPGILSACAIVEIFAQARTGPLVKMMRQIPLNVRWTHPNYFLEHVAFIPS